MTTCGAGEILEAEQGNRFLPRGQYSNATLEIDEPSTIMEVLRHIVRDPYTMAMTPAERRFVTYA